MPPTEYSFKPLTRKSSEPLYHLSRAREPAAQQDLKAVT